MDFLKPENVAGIVLLLLAIEPGYLTIVTWSRSLTWGGLSNDLDTVLKALALSLVIHVLVAVPTLWFLVHQHIDFTKNPWYTDIQSLCKHNPWYVITWLAATVIIVESNTGIPCLDQVLSSQLKPFNKSTSYPFKVLKTIEWGAAVRQIVRTRHPFGDREHIVALEELHSVRRRQFPECLLEDPQPSVSPKRPERLSSISALRGVECAFQNALDSRPFQTIRCSNEVGCAITDTFEHLGRGRFACHYLVEQPA
jgi:Family of unknown function (DUF6338)